MRDYLYVEIILVSAIVCVSLFALCASTNESVASKEKLAEDVARARASIARTAEADRAQAVAVAAAQEKEGFSPLMASPGMKIVFATWDGDGMHLTLVCRPMRPGEKPESFVVERILAVNSGYDGDAVRRRIVVQEQAELLPERPRK